MWALGYGHPEWVLSVPLHTWVVVGKEHHFSEPQPAGLFNGVLPAPHSECHCEDQVRDLAWNLHRERPLHLLVSIRMKVGVGVLSQNPPPRPETPCTLPKSHVSLGSPTFGRAQGQC